MVGRVTGQIRGGRFEVDNATAWTSKNYHWNTRDGGFVGWGQRAWAVAGRLATPDGPAVRLTYTSKDGDMVRSWAYPEVRATRASAKRAPLLSVGSLLLPRWRSTAYSRVPVRGNTTLVTPCCATRCQHSGPAQAEP